MEKINVTLVPLTKEDREKFILENQKAFKYGALEEFGFLDNHVNEDGEIISRKTIEQCIDDKNNHTYVILSEGQKVGGIIVKIDNETHHNHLEILFTIPSVHSKGIGYKAWKQIEELYPETIVWETCTPYFEKRNIHFYVNKCGFQIVEFICEYHLDKSMDQNNDEGPDEMFKFIKYMKKEEV